MVNLLWLQFCNTAPGTFDLILMDIMMPEMNGYETTKAIRNLSDRPDGKEIPIIAMTANAFAEDVQAALDAGMDDHVAKPIEYGYFNFCHRKMCENDDMAEIFKLFQKADVLVLATPVYFYRYRGTPQGSVQARTLTRCSRKSPSVMAF